MKRVSATIRASAIMQSGTTMTLMTGAEMTTMLMTGGGMAAGRWLGSEMETAIATRQTGIATMCGKIATKTAITITTGITTDAN